MILVIDNYDSFTYNLVQYLGILGEKLVVYRNDKINIKKIKSLKISKIVISPGPGTPLSDGGISNEVIKQFMGKVPVLGVCLGHQCIGHVLGAKIVRAKRLMHGKTSPVYHDGKKIYKGIPSPFTATRYHSLIIERGSVPDCVEITAQTKEGEIMGIRHKEFSLEGVQFHPESILTEVGMKLLKNFVKGKNK
jgi:anthranilate synthase/aminodeoxychorismate synthase-like glutamine amidotransferase